MPVDNREQLSDSQSGYTNHNVKTVASPCLLLRADGSASKPARIAFATRHCFYAPLLLLTKQKLASCARRTASKPWHPLVYCCKQTAPLRNLLVSLSRHDTVSTLHFCFLRSKSLPLVLAALRQNRGIPLIKFFYLCQSAYLQYNKAPLVFQAVPYFFMYLKFIYLYLPLCTLFFFWIWKPQKFCVSGFFFFVLSFYHFFCYCKLLDIVF